MTSASSEEDLLLKHFYQTNKFSLEDENVSNQEKADKLRRLLFFLEKLLAIKRISETSYRIMEKELSLHYRSILDNMDKEKGLDNYSEMISVLTEGKKNESKHWVSHLSLDEDNLPLCVEKALGNQGKKEERKMKISFSKTSHHKENGLSLNKRSPTIQHRGGDITNPHPPLKESSHDLNENNLHVPRFGKRKQNYPDESNKCEKKMTGNNIFYKDHGSNYEKRKTIIYRRKGEVVNKEPDDADEEPARNPFLTAGQQLRRDKKKSGNVERPTNSLSYGQTKKSLGAKSACTRVGGKFVPPIGQEPCEKKQSYSSDDTKTSFDSKYEEFEWMKNVDPKMVELVENEIMDHGDEISWDDIAGLEFAKATIQEIVIWPMLRPDLFTGLRGPPKGLLLFGPPGTGKTLIGKCIASQSNAKFFNISASSLTSKWIGDGEKMVRALFGVARCVQPAVIFIDEIDSLLTQRSDTEHESSRRLKTEFLVQLDGATASSADRLLVVGATNRPQELDEAARRRLVKRLYIPLPDADARKHIINNLMANQLHDLQDEDINKIVEKSNGFSGADMANLCRDAALGPIRGIVNIRNINVNEVRPVHITDFLTSLNHVRPSVSQNDLQVYVEWNRLYGSGG